MRSVTGPVAAALVVSVGLSLSGCSTPHAFVAPDPTWQVHTGQLVYTQDRTTLTGDLTVHHRGPRDFQLEFFKPGGARLMLIRIDHEDARAEGYLMKRPWEGRLDSAPHTVRPWLALRDAFLQPRPSVLGGIALWQGQVEYRDGLMSDVSIAFPEYHQNFVISFHP